MNIYCFSTLSFAKLQFKSVINKAFHKHGVASFTDAWIETLKYSRSFIQLPVASFTDAWIETIVPALGAKIIGSHLLQMRGLKLLKLLLILLTSPSHLLQMRGLKHKREKDKPIP